MTPIVPWPKASAWITSSFTWLARPFWRQGHRLLVQVDAAHLAGLAPDQGVQAKAAGVATEVQHGPAGTKPGQFAAVVARIHLDDFVAAYNFGRRLKTLNGLTPFEFVCKRWTSSPERFRLNPLQQMPGLNT